MPDFTSNEEFFATFRDLVERIEKQGHAEAARELRDGFACLNGLTDGWALLMEAMERVVAGHRDKIGKPEMPELREMLRGVRKVVYRR
jgi:hypothetical protein